MTWLKIFLFINTVDSLQFVSIGTRLDITYFISKISCFKSKFIQIDSQSIIRLVINLKFYFHTKYINIKYHMILK